MRYFLDTEFIERGAGRPILFLSIGIVAEDGREYYCEHPDARRLVNEDYTEFHDRWLIDNVRPHLHDGAGGPFRGRDIAAEIWAFCDPDRATHGVPEFWAYFADYDWVVFCQLFGRMVCLPKGWPMYCLDVKQLMKTHEIKRDDLPPDEKNKEHHALTDARWTAEAYRLIEEKTRKGGQS